MSRESRYSEPHWARDVRARKGLSHLILDGRTVCTGRKARRADYVTDGDHPPMPVCDTCWRASVALRNADRLAT